VNVVLLSTYELGHQPFGLASPAAWLKRAGARVTCLDLAVERLEEQVIAPADLVAFYVPMHTATRIATKAAGRVQKINPDVHLCFYGLYAPMNEAFLRKLGAHTILGGEFEAGLVRLVERLSKDRDGVQPGLSPKLPPISLARQQFLVPDRDGLPPLRNYARLQVGSEQRVAGYTEASRGCKHFCRHCPIVPVYEGRFRVVQRDVVLEDIRRQIEAGAQHITFGDPDFFNGPGHAIPLVKAIHERWPQLTYDVTIKIEHLLKHAQHLVTLRDSGCLFVTSAVESVDDGILKIFDKRHSREDFVRAVSVFREMGMTLNPTFVTFTPWTSAKGYLDLLRLIGELNLVDHISPIQYAIRLLIPSGSKLLELPLVHEVIGEFDETALCYRWSHLDPRIDHLYSNVLDVVKQGQAGHESRQAIFGKVWELAVRAADLFDWDGATLPTRTHTAPRPTIPCLTEPWFC
jgi:radical SAM superfamily enzyme YgiQ (UPF0313 family)